LYQDQNPVIQLTGKKGGLDMNSRDVTIEGKVLARSQDGITFETNSLKWQNQARLLYTPDPVKITKTNVLIQGRGLTADMALQKLNIQHEVTTIINYG
jgi:LPS export ABC transporter protein LptC